MTKKQQGISIKWIVLGVVIVVLVFAVVMLLNTARNGAMTLVYPERSQPTQTPDDFDIAEWEEVQFTSSDGIALEAWFIPPAADADGKMGIFVHGFGGNRGRLLPQAVIAAESFGYGALLLDLRNHGESAGTRTTMGLNEVLDVKAAYEYLLTREEVNPEHIILVGESLGAATVIRSGAAIPEVRAVVAQAGYSSLADNVEEGVRRLAGLPPFPFAPLVMMFAQQEAQVNVEQVRPIDDIVNISPRPVLLMHGDADELIDISNSERLYAAEGENKSYVVFPGAGHANLHNADRELFTTYFVEFLAGLQEEDAAN